MRYFGPKTSPEPIWWDVTAPPSALFGGMLKEIICLAELSERIPLQGMLLALSGDRCIPVAVRLEPLYRIELSWNLE
jgi:hypothetical protein